MLLLNLIYQALQKPFQGLLRLELRRAVANGHYEATPEGILFPRQRLHMGGFMLTQVEDGPLRAAPNVWVQEGRLSMLDVFFGSTAKHAGFYLAPFSANVTPAETLTAATFPGTMTEFTNYTEATRPTWNLSGAVASVVAGVPQIKNLDESRNPLTFGAGGGTVFGLGLTTAAAKSATTGKLVSVSKHATPDVVREGGTLRVGYGFQLVDAPEA